MVDLNKKFNLMKEQLEEVVEGITDITDYSDGTLEDAIPDMVDGLAYCYWRDLLEFVKEEPYMLEKVVKEGFYYVDPSNYSFFNHARAAQRHFIEEKLYENIIDMRKLWAVHYCLHELNKKEISEDIFGRIEELAKGTVNTIRLENLAYDICKIFEEMGEKEEGVLTANEKN